MERRGPGGWLMAQDSGLRTAQVSTYQGLSLEP
jgi:hypothetical protein